MDNINLLLKSAAKDTIYYTVSKFIVGLTGILSIKLFTFLFAPDVYGDYVLVNTTVNVLMMVLLGWLIHSGFRFIHDYSTEIEGKKSFYSTLVICAGAATLGSFLVSFLLIFILKMEFNPLILGGMLFLATQSNSQILFNLMRAYRLSGTYSLLLTAHALLKLGLIYLLAGPGQMGVESIFYGGIILDLAVIAFIIVRLNMHSHVKLKYFSRKKLQRFFTFGYPLMGVSIATWVLSASDKYIIKIFRDSAEVGVYAVSYSLVAAGFTLLNASLMLGTYPIILKTWREQGREETEELMGKIVRYYLLISVPACVGLSLLSRPVLTVLSTPEYIAGAFIIPWIAAGLVFQGLTEYATKVWELQEKTTILFFIMVAAAAVNIILNIILVPLFGFFAAAVTTVVSYIFYLGFALLLSRKIFSWKLELISLIRIGLAAATMALIFNRFAIIIVSDEIKLLLGIPLGAVIYFAVLLISGELKEEKKQIKNHLLKKWGHFGENS